MKTEEKAEVEVEMLRELAAGGTTVLFDTVTPVSTASRSLLGMPPSAHKVPG